MTRSATRGRARPLNAPASLQPPSTPRVQGADVFRQHKTRAEPSKLDLSSIAGMRRVAEQVNAIGTYDAVTHNAGVGYREPYRVDTIDGLEHIFAINVH
jgi:NAD(P)-dependent dehydrogenase (short-subunit alcohol dehydrogenase family)